MTEQQDLVDLINQNPDSVLFAIMLVDWLMEHRDMLHTEAKKHVTKVVTIAKAAQEVSLATALLAHGTTSQPVLRRRIKYVIQAPNPDAIIVLTVPGHQPPTVTTHSPELGSLPEFYRTVTVGSAWLMAQWFDWVNLNEACKPRRKQGKPRN